MKSCVYQILNIVNGKFYIGHTQDYDIRWWEHERRLIKNRHENLHLQAAWNKYGEDAFEFIIIELVSMENVLEREQFWINSLNSYSNKIGYNINPNAFRPPSGLGKKRSKETCDKISNATLGVPKSPYIRKPFTKEHKNNISLARRDFSKWPCEDGYNCKCDNCRRKRNRMKNYPQDRYKF